MRPKNLRHALMLIFAMALLSSPNGTAYAFQQKEAQPETAFTDRTASLLFAQIKEGLQGHSQKTFLAAFDLKKMSGGTLFKQQITSFFAQTGTIRVHLNLHQTSVEGTQGTALMEAEMEAEARDNNLPPLYKHIELHLTAQNGASGWKFTDVQPRSFFSVQP